MKGGDVLIVLNLICLKGGDNMKIVGIINYIFSIIVLIKIKS